MYTGCPGLCGIIAPKHEKIAYLLTASCFGGVIVLPYPIVLSSNAHSNENLLTHSPEPRSKR
jgi:hypothetical protein